MRKNEAWSYGVVEVDGLLHAPVGEFFFAKPVYAFGTRRPIDRGGTPDIKKRYVAEYTRPVITEHPFRRSKRIPVLLPCKMR